MCHSVCAAIRKRSEKEKSVKNLTRSVEQKIKMHTTKREFCSFLKNKTINKRLIKLGNLLVKFFITLKDAHIQRFMKCEAYWRTDKISRHLLLGSNI